MASPAAPPKSFASGRYSVRRLIGEGGQKIVYLARDTQLDRDVAIAVLKTEGLDETRVARVKREAQAMARLEAHSQIVAIYDIGEHEGRPYTICEYVPGGDLEQALRRAGGPLPIERALAIARDVCTALALTHARTVLHRDIKPSNIWLTADGSAKLGDFGLAVAEGRSRLTQAGTVLGTAVYMAPEQALGGEVDARADLYSLGCVLYELVTGRPPFVGDDTIAIVSQHINTAPVAPSWHRSEIPHPLEMLIMQLIAKSPQERPETATVVLAAIEAIMALPRAGEEHTVQQEGNPLDRLAGGVFVGRERELAELRGGLDEAFSGHGRLVLLTGEAGIGKTRLAEELATYAQMRGAQVLWGRCYEGEGAPAYWPWVQAIRAYVYERAPETLLSELGTGAGDIAQVVTELRERLPNLPEPPTLEPEQARFRLFDSIATFLKNASRTQPLLLILDDLHRADRSSLLLLQFLARELRDARIIVLGGYRDIELGRQHPLSHTVAELAREQLSQRVTLQGLSEHNVAKFIEMTAGIEPPAGLVTTVYKETEGNPFFVKEVVSLLASERRLEPGGSAASWNVAIPESVRAVVGRRLDRLSETCDRVLTIASVIGREFSIDVLATVSRIDEDALLEALEEALAARVIMEVPQAIGSYRFAHGLIRETLYDEVNAIRRVRFHRQIGEALEQRYASRLEPHLAELAYHFAEAAHGSGDVEKAVDYARRAGEQAIKLYAYEDATGHYERALQPLDLKEPPDQALRCDLLLDLGEAQNAAGDAVHAKETLLTAANLAREISSPDRLARAALGYVGKFLGMVEIGKVDQTLVTMLEEALRGLSEEDRGLRTRVMARLAMELYFFASSEERREALSREAVDTARRLGDGAVLAEALRARHVAVWGPDNLSERLAVADEIMTLAAENRDPDVLVVGRNWRAADLIELGEMEESFELLDVNMGEAARKRRPDQIWSGLLGQVMRAMVEGRFEEGERLAQEALVVGQGPYPQTSLTAYGLQIATIRRDQGRLGEMEEGLKTFAVRYPAIAGYRWSLPLIYCETGREAEATAEVERLASSDFADIPRDALWLVSMFLAAEVCTNLGDASRAATLYNLLLPYAARNVTAYGIVCWGSAEQTLGRLAAAMERWKEAEEHFEAALAWNRKIRAAPWLVRTQLYYAEMLLARHGAGDREKAVALLSQALETAQKLGMAALTERIHALQLQGVDRPRT